MDSHLCLRIWSGMQIEEHFWHRHVQIWAWRRFLQEVPLTRLHVRAQAPFPRPFQWHFQWNCEENATLQAACFPRLLHFALWRSVLIGKKAEDNTPKSHAEGFFNPQPCPKISQAPLRFLAWIFRSPPWSNSWRPYINNSVFSKRDV